MSKRVAIAKLHAQVEYGGYDFNFTKPVPDKFYCSICTKALHDPHLTECCGQHFCKSCLEHWFRKESKTTCPHCRHGNFLHILNKALKREIDELEIQCTKQRVGCQWVGELSSLPAHLNSDEGCGYIEVQCSNKCGVKLMRKELKVHLEQQCPLRKIKCQYCYYKDTYQIITSQHYSECLQYPLPCPNKCGMAAIRRAEMANHRSKCELEPVECPFHEAGCTVRVVRRDFDVHMSKNQQNHLLVLLGTFQETKRELHISKTELGECQRELGECQRKLGENQKQLSKCQRELGECRRELGEKLHNTSLIALEFGAMKNPPITLKKHGKPVTYCMTNFSLYKQTGKVWHSPPFYFDECLDYKLCLAVYANGKGVGAGTHVSVELLQMREERDAKWKRGHGAFRALELSTGISIQMMTQCKQAEPPVKQFLLQCHLCFKCFSRMPRHENLGVCRPCGFMGNDAPITEELFIDYQSAEQLMVLNDTIILKVEMIHYKREVLSDSGSDS